SFTHTPPHPLRGGPGGSSARQVLTCELRSRLRSALRPDRYRRFLTVQARPLGLPRAHTLRYSRFLTAGARRYCRFSTVLPACSPSAPTPAPHPISPSGDGGGRPWQHRHHRLLTVNGSGGQRLAQVAMPPALLALLPRALSTRSHCLWRRR